MVNLEQVIQTYKKSQKRFRAFEEGQIKEMEIHRRDYIKELQTQVLSKDLGNLMK